MSQYEELDQRVIKAIEQSKNPIYDKHVNEEAVRIAAATGREGFRVIDGRLQALRKAGRIKHVRETGLKPQWVLAYPE